MSRTRQITERHHRPRRQWGRLSRILLGVFFALLLLVSLLLVAVANLRLVYSVSVDGAPLEGSWSRQSVENAYDAAMAAAEEVARGGAVPPELETEARLSILPARGEVSELAEAILCSAGGV